MRGVVSLAEIRIRIEIDQIQPLRNDFFSLNLPKQIVKKDFLIFAFIKNIFFKVQRLQILDEFLIWIRTFGKNGSGSETLRSGKKNLLSIKCNLPFSQYEHDN